LLNHYRKLIQVRNANPALNGGPLTMLQTDDATGTIAAWLRSSRDEAFLIVVNFGPPHRELLMERLPRNFLPGGGEYRLDSAYADPDNACAGYYYGSFHGSGSILIRSVEAHGFCALRIRRP
jgi:glycosidase